MLFVIRNNCNIMLHRFHRIFEERKEEIEAIPLRESSPRLSYLTIFQNQRKWNQKKKKKNKGRKRKIIKKNPTLRPETSNLSRYVWYPSSVIESRSRERVVNDTCVYPRRAHTRMNRWEIMFKIMSVISGKIYYYLRIRLSQASRVRLYVLLCRES